MKITKKIKLLLFIGLMTGSVTLSAQWNLNALYHTMADYMHWSSDETGTAGHEGYEYRNINGGKDGEQKPLSMPKTMTFDYDRIAADNGLVLQPEDSFYLDGSKFELAGLCEQSFLSSPTEGIGFFISLERYRHGDAMVIFNQLLSNNIRFVILRHAPVEFVGKLLVGIQKHFVESKVVHEGRFVVDSKFLGKRLVSNQSLINGKILPLLYIRLLLSHASDGSREEGQARLHRFAAIVLGQTPENLINLMVYSKEELSVQLGEDNEICFGALQRRGGCSTDMFIEPLPVIGMLGSILVTVELDTQIALLEQLYRKDEESAVMLIKSLEKEHRAVLKEMIPHLSKGLLSLVSRDMLAYAMTGIEVPEYNDTQLLIEGIATQKLLTPVEQTVPVKNEDVPVETAETVPSEAVPVEVESSEPLDSVDASTPGVKVDEESDWFGEDL